MSLGNGIMAIDKIKMAAMLRTSRQMTFAHGGATMKNILTHKYCKKCEQTKELIEFNKKGKQSYSTYCRVCSNEISRDWYIKNIERAKTNSHNYYEENKAVVNERATKWRLENVEKARASVMKYLKSAKGILMRLRVDGEDRKERNRNYSLKWSHANPEKHRQITKEWRINNKDKYNHNKLVRYGREKGAEGKYTLAQWDTIVNYYCPSGECLSCGKKDKLTRDHVIPLVSGGSNYISNIQPLCRYCNSSKRDKTIDYRPDKGEFARRLQQDG